MCGDDNRQRAGGGTHGVHADTSSGSGHGEDDPTPTDPPSTASCAARRAATFKTQLTISSELDELDGSADLNASNDNAHDTVTSKSN